MGTGELADGAVSGAKIAQQGAAGGQVLKWNGTAWAPANDNGDTYTAGNGIAIAGNVVSNTGDIDPANDITTASTAGGDLSGTFNNLQLNASAVGTGELADGAVSGAKIAQQGAAGGQVLKWNGTAWAPQDDGFTGTLSGDVDGPPGSNEIKALRGRPLGGMPPTGANVGFAYIYDGAEWQLDTLHGDIQGIFNDAEVKALRGRPIGGMPPTGANTGFAYIYDGVEWQLNTPQGDLQGTFSDVEVKALRGRPIGGMPPTGASTALIHIPDPVDPDNAGSFEYSDPNGDITVDGAQRLRVSKIQDLAVDFSMGIGDGMVLTCVDNGGGLQFECRMPTGGFTVPYSNTPASYSSTLFSLTNTNSTTSQTIFPIKGTTANQYNLFGFGNVGQQSSTLSLKSFYYPGGVYGENTNTNPNAAGAGVLGRAIVSSENRGVGGWFQGNSFGTLSQCFQNGAAAVAGYSQGSRYGAYFKLVNAPSGGTDYAALYAETTNFGTAWAGYFVGDVNVTGTVYRPATNFKIDHPEDPENKYLIHASVESPEMKTLYDGIVTTDAQGYAIVDLPPYFEDLNGDIRYQLTVIRDFAQAIVSEKVKNGKFVIRTDKPGIEVSWQLTGVRKDPYAKAHPTVPEVEKPAAEKGTYLHPELYNQPASKLLGYRSMEIEE
ncbi:MAG: hypothetical protein IPM81_19630 [Saprospirales bacterium]|nr:hypothetical protein [Saprospirales bacterium]